MAPSWRKRRAARPFDAEPSVTVTRLGFLKLDLARLLPNSGVPGEVSGTVRGHARGRRLDQLRLSTVISLEALANRETPSHSRQAGGRPGGWSGRVQRRGGCTGRTSRPYRLCPALRLGSELCPARRRVSGSRPGSVPFPAGAAHASQRLASGRGVGPDASGNAAATGSLTLEKLRGK